MPTTASAFATPPLKSRLPQVGTTIFTLMSALAAKHGAVNLGQGFPDFECDPALLDLVHSAMREGLNQYPPMPGVAPLREAVSKKVEALYGHRYDPDTEVTITAGATQAILTVILCCVHPGDEVIVLEPCYDSYAPNIELAGGVVVRVPLDPGTFRPNFDAIAAAITPRTRAIMVNSPHNPSATVWTAAEMQQAGRTAGTDRHPADFRRGLRAHGVRRRAARQRGVDSRRWPPAASSSPASARPTTSLAGRSATWSRRQR